MQPLCCWVLWNWWDSCMPDLFWVNNNKCHWQSSCNGAWCAAELKALQAGLWPDKNIGDCWPDKSSWDCSAQLSWQGVCVLQQCVSQHTAPVVHTLCPGGCIAYMTGRDEVGCMPNSQTTAAKLEVCTCVCVCSVCSWLLLQHRQCCVGYMHQVSNWLNNSRDWYQGHRRASCMHW